MEEIRNELNMEELEEVDGGKAAYGGYTRKPGAKAGCKIHRIASGETLGRIAAHYGTTVQKIMKVNPELKDPNKILAHAYIYVPV